MLRSLLVPKTNKFEIDKTMKCGIKTLIGGVLLALGLTSASAVTTVAGFNFQDNAFADTVLSSSGTYTLGGAATLQAAVTGSSLTHYAFSFSPGAYIQVGFTDNYLVNGPGNDLALFEYGAPDSFGVRLTILGVTHTYATVFTGYTGVVDGTTWNVNVAQVNLDDFGVAAGAQLSSIVVGMDIVGGSGTVPSLGVVGALNSADVTSGVPDAGSTISLLGMAFLGLGALKRKM